MEKRCKNCRWFRHYVNPETGRKKSTIKGHCDYPLPWPDKWPCYAYANYRCDVPARPRARVFDSHGWNCETFEAKE